LFLIDVEINLSVLEKIIKKINLILKDLIIKCIKIKILNLMLLFLIQINLEIKDLKLILEKRNKFIEGLINFTMGNKIIIEKVIIRICIMEIKIIKSNEIKMKIM